MPKPRTSNPNEALRLVKSWLPSTLVREMDHTILATDGAYNGRDDFIREAISDRVAEERSRPNKGSATPVLLLSSNPRSKPSKVAPPEHESPETEANWLAGPTLPGHHVGGILYGLHNRDYPTLWAARLLLCQTSARGGPVVWGEFVSAVLDAAWSIGTQLTRMDLERGADEQKASVGFPTNVEKRQAAEARFLEHMVGVPDRQGGPTGPLFAMNLAGTKHDGKTFLVGPTREAIDLWTRLAATNLSRNMRPPHPPDAWHAFSAHLQANLAEDLSAWIRVLRAVGDGRSRNELITHFAPDWAGAAASTNAAGYVSRGREWGLIEPKQREGQYVLTDLGRKAAEGGR